MKALLKHILLWLACSAISIALGVLAALDAPV